MKIQISKKVILLFSLSLSLNLNEALGGTLTVQNGTPYEVYLNEIPVVSSAKMSRNSLITQIPKNPRASKVRSSR